MIQGFLILLFCQLAGELLVVLLDVPVPGSVVGMVLLFFGLIVLGRVPDPLRFSSEGVLKVLPLLLVPAGVGLMKHVGVISEYWEVLLLALFISTLLTMLLVGLLLKKSVRGEGGS